MHTNDFDFYLSFIEVKEMTSFVVSKSLERHMVVTESSNV